MTFVEKTKEELGIKANGREITQEGGIQELEEGYISYNPFSTSQNGGLRPKNTYVWDISF